MEVTIYSLTYCLSLILSFTVQNTNLPVFSHNAVWIITFNLPNFNFLMKYTTSYLSSDERYIRNLPLQPGKSVKQ